MSSGGERAAKPVLLVLASTYPRWGGDPEPGFVHELCRRLTPWFSVVAVVPDADRADPSGMLDGVEVIRYRYAPRGLQTLVNNGGIVANLRRSGWKWLLVPGFVLGQWCAARRVIRRRGVALVHAHWLIPQGMVARLLTRAGRIPYVVTSHGGDLFGLRGWMLTSLKRGVASSSGAMTVVSSAMGQEVSRAELNPPELHVIPMGVDLRNRFVPDASVIRSSSELLFVGRLVPKKGVDLLLEAMPAIRARRPGISLTIVGFGPEEGRLRALAQALGLAECVHFVGALRQDELPPLYQRAALFVAPFRRDSSGDQEGLPVALMEALCCGCPAVVGDVPGVRDLLGNDSSEGIVPCDDSRALAEEVVHALTHQREARARADDLMHSMRMRVDWDHVAEAFADVLLRAAHLPRTGSARRSA